MEVGSFTGADNQSHNVNCPHGMTVVFWPVCEGNRVDRLLPTLSCAPRSKCARTKWKRHEPRKRLTNCAKNQVLSVIGEEIGTLSFDFVFAPLTLSYLYCWAVPLCAVI